MKMPLFARQASNELANCGLLRLRSIGPRVRWPESYSVPHYRSNCTHSQFAAVLCERRFTARDLIPRFDIHEPDDAGVGLTENHREFAEVLVERDQDSRLPFRDFQYRRVAGIGFPIARPRNVVACRRQRRPRAWRHASVEQQLQAIESTKRGSTRSRPTKRRAYTRQARMSSLSRYG